jgi:hypothetical protein
MLRGLLGFRQPVRIGADFCLQVIHKIYCDIFVAITIEEYP